jgi:hypothetical protein
LTSDSLKVKKNYKTLKFSASELRNSVEIMVKALKEGHPGLYDYISKEDFLSLYKQTIDKINFSMTADQFYIILLPLITGIHDNHTWLERDYIDSENFNYVPDVTLPIEIRCISGKCFLVKDPLYTMPPGSEITAINREPIDTLMPEIIPITGTGDGNFGSWTECLLAANNFCDYYTLLKDIDVKDKITVRFTDGQKKEYAAVLKNKSDVNEVKTNPFIFKEISEGINYIKISKVMFSAEQRTEFSRYMDKIKNDKRKIIILDLRDNLGGPILDAHFIYSFFARERFQPESLRIVNSNTEYSFFDKTNNMIPGSMPYESYQPEDDGSRFILTPAMSPKDFPPIIPNRTSLFTGKVYVMTNGCTGSAAFALASYFRLQKRGIIAGMEGANNYYKMNACDFAELHLGNTGLILHIPLVQIHLTNMIDSENQPARGLIPDHSIPITVKGLLHNEDEVLNFVLAHIKKDKAEPFKQIGAIAGSGLLLFLSLFFIKRKKGKPPIK